MQILNKTKSVRSVMLLITSLPTVVLAKPIITFSTHVAPQSNAYKSTHLLLTEAFKGSCIKQVGPMLSTLAIHSFIHKKHKALVPKLAFALHQMMLDGSYLRLIKQSRKIYKL